MKTTRRNIQHVEAFENLAQPENMSTRHQGRSGTPRRHGRVLQIVLAGTVALGALLGMATASHAAPMAQATTASTDYTEIHTDEITQTGTSLHGTRPLAIAGLSQMTSIEIEPREQLNY